MLQREIQRRPVLGSGPVKRPIHRREIGRRPRRGPGQSPISGKKRKG